MSVKYQKVWDTMNDLETIIAKVVSAREMIDVANEAISVNDQDRAEKMAMAAYEFLGYFIEEFDEKFKKAWQATVGDLRDGDVKENPCMPPWGHSDLEYGIANQKKDKVTKWQLPIEVDGPSAECFVTFPDDLLEAANLEEGDQIEWVDQGDGSYLLRKVIKPLGMDDC
jgi:hypothetical protein